MNATQLRAFDELSAAVGYALWPITVTIAAVNYAAAAPKPKPRATLEEGYESESMTHTIRIRKSILATAPARDTFLTWNSIEWKIRAIGGQDAANAEWVLEIEKTK
jgi:hypothetical protein